MGKLIESPKISKLWKQIQAIFSNYPYLSNSVVYGALFVGAEFWQQVLTRKVLSDPRKPFDWSSIKRFAFYGTCIQGPFLTTWYRWLDKRFPGSSNKIIVQKVLLDQFFIAPNSLALFYVVMNLLEGRNATDELRRRIVPTFKISCFYWLPVQVANFYLIPPTFRVVVVGVCSFAWVHILCYMYKK